MKRILNLLKKLIPSALQLIVIAGFVIIAFVAYNTGARSGHGGGETVSSVSSGSSRQTSSSSSSQNEVDSNGDGIIYTCSMHPQIKQNEPGDCPICGMELVPVDVGDSLAEQDISQSAGIEEGEDQLLGYACAMNCVPPLEEPGDCPICGMEMQAVYDDSGATDHFDHDPQRRLQMSEQAKAIASIQTSKVERRVPKKTIRLFGELAVSEDTLVHISLDVGGRIDKLSARYEGDLVEKGEELILLYSPELLAVQQEFLQAKTSLEGLRETTLESVRRSSESVVKAARERLRLAGLSHDQIDEIAQSGEAREQVRLYAPVGGTVITRHLEEGQYSKKGERILTIARLDNLWAEIAAYESDLPWLKVGQPVTFSSEAFPGERFEGEVAWIDPVSSSRTRTTRVRLNVNNTRSMLRPGMYLTAFVEATLGDDSKLIIPDTAPLITGERAIVYTADVREERPTYIGKEIVLGPRVNGGYIVNEGLNEGDLVVTNGAFQIDSALQIVAKKSMMSPSGGEPVAGHANHGSPSEEQGTHEHESDANLVKDEGRSFNLDDYLSDYLHLQRALANDDYEHALHVWNELSEEFSDLEVFHSNRDVSSIDKLRKSFQPLSQDLIGRLDKTEYVREQDLHLVHCPMAFDFEGAEWIQAGEEVRNPYFGDEMLTCGTLKKDWGSND